MEQRTYYHDYSNYLKGENKKSVLIHNLYCKILGPLDKNFHISNSCVENKINAGKAFVLFTY